MKFSVSVRDFSSSHWNNKSKSSFRSFSCSLSSLWSPLLQHRTPTTFSHRPTTLLPTATATRTSTAIPAWHILRSTAHSITTMVRGWDWDLMIEEIKIWSFTRLLIICLSILHHLSKSINFGLHVKWYNCGNSCCSQIKVRDIFILKTFILKTHVSSLNSENKVYQIPHKKSFSFIDYLYFNALTSVSLCFVTVKQKKKI